MLFQSCLPGLADRFGSGRRNDKDDRSLNIRSVLKMDSSTGALQIPSYTQISRADHCPLLKHAWGQNWEEVIKICASQPWRTLHMTKYSGRTALHLATFDRSCPLRVARALLKANRQMIVVRDSNNYTPLHIVAFFSAANSLSNSQIVGSSSDENDVSSLKAVAVNSMGRILEEERGGSTQLPATVHSRTTKEANAESEAISVMSVFCDTAIMVEQELGRDMGKNWEEQQLPLLEGTSPLYLAAKKAAPLSILKVLLETRSRTKWIAPSTGGEPYWYGSTDGNCTIREKKTPNASFSSPLEILLREDRLRSSMNASYYRNDTYLLGEEEDGNILRRGRARRSSSSSEAASRSCNIPASSRRSPLHPDEIDGAPHLRREMQRIAIARCREHHEEIQNGCNDGQSRVANHDSGVFFSHSQQRCLELWEKCIELLVTAGGGGVPVLMSEENEDTDEAANPSDEKYGILHACVCCKVPVPSLVEIALLLFPEQAFKRDTMFGLTPLQHVLRAKHKYSYATSNLLTILLKGRNSIGAPLCSKKTRKAKIQPEKALSTEFSREDGYGMAGFPVLPSLSSCTICDHAGDSNKMLQSYWPDFRYLRSTVLLPFPCRTNSYLANDHEYKVMDEFKGQIPLIYAIRLGLPMDGVIDKLLEADSHESLGTLDPISKLPPFALVAMRVCCSESKEEYDTNNSSAIERSLDPSCKKDQIATALLPATRNKNEHSNDLITAAIGSAINALSSGDGSSVLPASSVVRSFPSSSVPNSRSCTSVCRRSPTNDDNNSGSAKCYKLDDVYRLLLAHPQVLAQYNVE